MYIFNLIFTGAVPNEVERVKELLEKLAEYKPLAKIEEMEEQNYNMIDNVLSNGAEKKAQVTGRGQENEIQKNAKKNHKEMKR